MFCKNEGLKRSNNNEKCINKIKNKGENWYKLLQKCQMTDFCEKNIPTLGQIISELNMMETNQFFPFIICHIYKSLLNIICLVHQGKVTHRKKGYQKSRVIGLSSLHNTSYSSTIVK